MTSAIVMEPATKPNKCVLANPNTLEANARTKLVSYLMLVSEKIIHRGSTFKKLKEGSRIVKYQVIGISKSVFHFIHF